MLSTGTFKLNHDKLKFLKFLEELRQSNALINVIKSLSIRRTVMFFHYIVRLGRVPSCSNDNICDVNVKETQVLISIIHNSEHVSGFHILCFFLRVRS